tara:strand:- start:103 stop:1281 length:1179 start_codon:yes stop_codon:yes gene_type:complete
MSPPQANRRPIVAFAHHPWVEPEWMNRQQLLSRLGQRGWPVAYSCGPLDWWQRGTPRWAASSLLNRVEDRDNIRDIIPGRIGARWKRHPAFDRLALARHAKFIRNAVARPDERIIAMLFDPQFYPYIEHLQPCDITFHAYDAYAGQSGWTEEKAHFQAALLGEAQVITASSEAIARYLNTPKAIVLPNGADVDSFLGATKLPEPDDLRDIPHPRLGYVGAINRKVDLVLVAAIAKQRPDWHWGLVGRIERNELLADEYNAEAFRLCESLPNVHFLGQKDRRAVPAYVGHMDVNTMCYRAKGDGWWTAISPLKLHEYLAAGLPVVSAEIESVIPYKSSIALASDLGTWVDQISNALGTQSIQAQESRCEVAKANSWDARVDQLEGLLNEHRKK